MITERKKHDAKYRESHRNEIRQRDNEYRRGIGKEARQVSAKKQREKVKNSPELYEQLCDYNRKYLTSRRKELKNKIFNIFNSKCNFCGYDENIHALQIDHINGGGTQHRKTFPSLTKYYEYILKVGISSGEFQMLCANCNQIKRMERKEFKGQ